MTRQAIEERSILDMLQDYTEYDVSYELESLVEDVDIEAVDEEAARKDAQHWAMLRLLETD